MEFSGSDTSTAARLGGWLFRHRGVIPVPLVAIALARHGIVTPLAFALGGVLVASGEALRLWGVAAAGPETRRRSRAVSRLVTHGPFAWLRNPLYAANGLIWAGFSVACGIQSMVPVALALCAIEYSLIVLYEESVLEATFGNAYVRYKQRTPRWLPVAPAHVATGALRWGAAWRSESSTLLQVVLLAAVLATSQVVR